MDQREQEIRAEERARMIALASGVLETSTENLIAQIIAVVAPIERKLAVAIEALTEIAGGVPRDDEWRSAASFMEYVAEILEHAGVNRPAHYENEEEWR